MAQLSRCSMFVSLVVLSLLLFDLTNGQQETRPKKKARSRRRCSMWTSRVWSVCYITPKCSPKARCPAFPNAECKKVRDCNSCREVWLVDGEQVNCEACPPGFPQQSCSYPACKAVKCDDPQFKDKPCRSNICGGCFAEFLFDRNDWRECPNARYVEPNGTSSARLIPRQPDMQPNNVQRASFDRPERPRRGRQGLRERFGLSGPAPRPRDRSAGPGDVTEITSCPRSSPEVPCPRTLCTNATCPRYPDARCVIDACGVCHVDWLVGRRIVNCNEGPPLKKCPRGVRAFTNCAACSLGYCELYPEAECRVDHCLKCKAEYFVDGRPVECRPPLELTRRCPNPAHKRYVCPKEMCRFEVCPNNHRVYCTVDNCGGCRAVYKYKWTNEVTTCNGYWSRYEQDTAKMGYEYQSPQGELPNNNDPVSSATNVDPSGQALTPASAADETLRQQTAELERLERIILQEQLELMNPGRIPSDPHAGHNHGPVRNRPSGRIDPHAGHGHATAQDQSQTRPIGAIDPHAGHGHATAQDQSQARPIGAIDPHAGHGHATAQDQSQSRSIGGIDQHAGHGHATAQDQSQTRPIGGIDPHAGHGHEASQQQFLDTPPNMIDTHTERRHETLRQNRPIGGMDPHAGHGHESVQSDIHNRPISGRADQHARNGPENQDRFRTRVNNRNTRPDRQQDTPLNQNQINSQQRRPEPMFSGVPVDIGGGHESQGHEQPAQSQTSNTMIDTQNSRRIDNSAWRRNQLDTNTAEQHNHNNQQRNSGRFIDQAQAENRARHIDPARDPPIWERQVNTGVVTLDEAHQSDRRIQGGAIQGIPIPNIQTQQMDAAQFSSQASDPRPQRPLTDRITRTGTRNSGSDITQTGQISDSGSRRRQNPPVNQNTGPVVSSNQNGLPVELPPQPFDQWASNNEEVIGQGIPPESPSGNIVQQVLSGQPGIPIFPQPTNPLPTNTEELNIFHSLNDFPVSMNLADFWSMARDWTRNSQQTPPTQQP